MGNTEKLKFSYSREGKETAGGGIGVIRYLSKDVSCNVLDQMYKLCLRLYLDYDPDLTFEFY